MAERVFQSELIRGAYAMGWHPVPIPDQGKADRFSPRKIYDLGLLSDGVYFAVELKEVAGQKYSWPIRQLAPHQEANLADAAAKGGVPIVVVNFAIRLSPKRAEIYGEATVKQAFAVHLSDLRLARDEECRTSLNLDWFRFRAWELEPVYGIVNENNEEHRAWSPDALMRLHQHRLGLAL